MERCPGFSHTLQARENPSLTPRLFLIRPRSRSFLLLLACSRFACRLQIHTLFCRTPPLRKKLKKQVDSDARIKVKTKGEKPHPGGQQGHCCCVNRENLKGNFCFICVQNIFRGFVTLFDIFVKLYGVSCL